MKMSFCSCCGSLFPVMKGWTVETEADASPAPEEDVEEVCF